MSTHTALTDDALTERARKILADLSNDETVAFRRIAYAVQFHSDRRWQRGSALHTWATSGPSSAAAVLRTLLDAVVSIGLAVRDREGWNLTGLGREVARLIAEST